MAQPLLIHCRRSPYKDSLARGAIEFAMAAAVFEQEIQLLFSGDGIWQLLKNQQAGNISAKNHGKLLSALPLYGVDAILVDERSLENRGLNTDDFCVDVQVINHDTIKQLIADSSQVFNF